MPLPAAGIAALLIGGGLAAKEYSSRAASDRLHRRNLEYLERFKAMEEGQAMDDSAAVLRATGQMPATKAPQVPGTATPRTPRPSTTATPGGGRPSTAPPTIEEPEPEAIAHPRRRGYTVTPRMLKEHNLNTATGALSIKMKENAEYFKLEQEKAFATTMKERYQHYSAEGYRPREARTKAYTDSAIMHGLQGSVSDWKQLYPDLTEGEKYNAARNGLLTHIENGVDFERAWQLLSRRFPDLTLEARTKIANEIYLLRQAMFFDEAMDLKREEGFTGPALEAEALLEAARMAATQGLQNYLPREELERIGPKVTRVGEVPGEAGRVLRQRYPRNAIVSPGAIADAQSIANQQEVLQTMEVEIGRQRAAAGAQAEQIMPLIDDLETMITALNTEEEFFKRMWSKGALTWAAIKQSSDQWIEIDGEMENVGVIAADYRDASLGFLGKLARTFGGERGVLTQQDIERAAKFLPQLGTSKDLTARKMKRLRSHIQEIINRANIAAKDPNYINPNPVPNDAASIRKLTRKLKGTTKLLKGAKGSLEDLTKGYE